MVSFLIVNLGGWEADGLHFEHPRTRLPIGQLADRHLRPEAAVELGQVHPPGVLARDADQLPDRLAVEHAALKDERA